MYFASLHQCEGAAGVGRPSSLLVVAKGLQSNQVHFVTLSRLLEIIEAARKDPLRYKYTLSPRPLYKIEISVNMIHERITDDNREEAT